MHVALQRGGLGEGNIQDDEIWKTGSILRECCMEMRREDGHVDQGLGAVESENEQVEGR